MGADEWTVYIIRAESGRLYTGITTDLERRLKNHQGKRGGAKFFRFSDPECVVYTESCANRSKASKREAAIKKLDRGAKLALIEKTSPIPGGKTRKEKTH